MSGFVLAVRPQPGLAATMAAGEALGLNMVGYPLFEVRPVAWDCPDPATIDALLIGSANAIRHGGAALDRLKGKPVHAVGETTAQVAREAGFAVAKCGQGGLQKVLDTIPAQMRLLRLAGADHVDLDPPKDVTIALRVVYETVPMELPEALHPLHDLDLTVLLHSAAAAQQFASESRRLGLERSRITLALIGPRLVEPAGTGWRAIHVSRSPNDHALLELVREMCI